MPTFTRSATQALGENFFAGRVVHDIECHNFAETQKFLGLGAKVIGLDKSEYAQAPEGIRFIKEDFLNWSPEESVDILFSKNVMLFMECDKVFQKITELNPNVIIIQTMYDFPDPNWPKERLKKLYFTRVED